MVINLTSILLFLSLLIALFLSFKIKKISNKNNLMRYYSLINILLMIYLVALIIQILFSNTAIKSLYFDYIAYIGAVLVPVVFFAFSREYSGIKNANKNLKYYFIIPVISLLVIWTSDFHKLFYAQYSTIISEVGYGPYFYIHMIYTYGILIISFINVIITSIRKSGFLSTPTLLLIIGALAPLIPNVLGSLKIISISIYITPISFIITSILYYISIFKLKALNIIPIALRTVVDNISDAFVVISEDGTIADKNNTFEKKFNYIFNLEENDNFFEAIIKNNLLNLEDIKHHIEESRINDNIVTKEYHILLGEEFDKYFEIDIQSIKTKNNKEYAGTLLLFKDITQHKKDIEIIEQKQDIIVKQGQLVTIGELAGGVAHDINTPISAIKSGILMFREMTGVRTEDEKEILQRMDNCADKIIKIVNSMRNQIRNLGGTTNVEFKISEVINDIKIISYNEVKKYKCDLIINIEDDLSIKGDPTKLGQVLTNLIVNAVQAYKDKGGKVEVILTKAPDNMALIKIIDYAGGMDETIKPYVFKNILTTKGTLGTGLGLYLAYSVIKGEFGGDITFESEEGIGTTFYIAIKRV